MNVTQTCVNNDEMVREKAGHKRSDGVVPHLAVVSSDVQPPEGHVLPPHNLNIRHEPCNVDHVLEMLVSVGGGEERGRGICNHQLQMQFQ